MKERQIQVLEVMEKDPEHGFTYNELSEQTDLNRSVIQAVVGTLVKEGRTRRIRRGQFAEFFFVQAATDAEMAGVVATSGSTTSVICGIGSTMT